MSGRRSDQDGNSSAQSDKDCRLVSTVAQKATRHRGWRLTLALGVTAGGVHGRGRAPPPAATGRPPPTPSSSSWSPPERRAGGARGAVRRSPSSAATAGERSVSVDGRAGARPRRPGHGAVRHRLAVRPPRRRGSQDVGGHAGAVVRRPRPVRLTASIDRPGSGGSRRVAFEVVRADRRRAAVRGRDRGRRADDVGAGGGVRAVRQRRRVGRRRR